MSIRFINNGKSGGGSVSLNIFTGLAEPEKKDGIWLQSNKQIEKYIFDNDIIFEESWNTDIVTLPYAFSSGSVVLVGDEIYMFGGFYSIYDIAYKYNFKTGLFTQLTNTPLVGSDSKYARAVSVGKNIYLLLKKSIYKYDTENDNYTLLNDNECPIEAYDNVTFLYEEGNIYIGKDLLFYKYNIENNEFSTVYSGSSNYYSKGILYNHTIYLIRCASSSSQSIYKIDLEENTLNKLLDVNLSLSSSVMIPAICEINGIMYIFSPYYGNNSENSKKCYKYDIVLNTLESIDEAPRSCSSASVIIYNNKIYIVGGYFSYNSTRYNTIIKYNLAFKDFQDKSVIISQKTGSMQTKIIDINETGGLINFFSNVWYYDEDGGIDNTIPTYYGNGTEWIKFKN